MEYHEFLDTVDELEEEEEKLKHDQASESVGKKGERKLCEMAVTSKRTLSGVEVQEEISSAPKNRLSEDYLEGNGCNLREKSLESDRRTVDQPEKNDYYYKIYTQWANHYLERCDHPRRVSNLQTDLADGIILATIIEAISGQTFPLIVDPVNPTEKYDNITRCLNFLLSLGMKLNGVLAQDIFDGNLKSILKLFYALSRFKQNQKPSLIAQSNFGFSHKSNRTASQATSRPTISNRLNVPRQSNDDPKKIEYQYLTNNNDLRIRKDEFDLTNNQQSTGRGRQESLVNNNNNPYNVRQHRTNGCPKNLTFATTPGISGIGCEIPNSVALQFSNETSVESAVNSKIPNLSTEGKLSKENLGRRSSIDQQPVVVEVVDQKNSGHEDKSPTDTISKKKSTNSMLEKFKFFGTKDKSRDKLKDSDSKIKFETNGEKVAEKPSTSSNSVAGKRTEARKTNVADKRSDVPRTTSNNNSRTALATSFDEQDQKNVGNLSYSGRNSSAASKSSSIAVPSNSVAARRLVSPSGYKSIGVERGETTDSCSVVKGSGNSRQGTAVVASQLGGIAVKTSKIASTASSAKGTNLRVPQNTAAVASSQQTRMASAKTTSNGKRTNENERNKSSNIAKVTAVTPNSVPVRQDGQISARRASQQAANVFSSKDCKTDQRLNNVSVVHNKEPEGLKQSKVVTGAMQLPGSVGDKQAGHIQTKSSASKAGPSPGIEPAPGFSYETNAATFSSFKPQQKQQQQPQLGQKQQQQQYQSSDAGLRLSQKQLSQNVKVKKIDSDTQTSSSAIQQSKPQLKHITSDQLVNTQTQIPSNSRLDQKMTKAAYQDARDLSCGSLSSVSTNVSGAGEESTRSSSNSNSNNSASSTDSVIFRPSSCDESGTDVEGGRNNRAKTANVAPSCVAAGPQSTDHISNLRNKKCDNQQQTTKSNGVHSDSQNGENSFKFDDSIKPMQPLSSSSPYAYLRSLPTSPAKPALHGPTMSPGGSMSGQAPSSRLAMYRPLMDTSRSYMNSTRRGVSGNARRYDQDSDAEGFDVTAGYMSDGEILKSSYLDDVNCGYMSEGGVSQYVKRMQQRFREGMLAVKECMEKSNGAADNESTGDASSISSGEISDAINDISTDDNITGSSLSGASSEQNSMKQAFGYLGSDVLYGSHSLPPSQRACLQQTRTLGMGLRGTGQNSTSCMARADGSSAENWQKYTIPEEMNSCGSGSRMFNRGTLDRSTLPVTARERGDSRDALNSCGRERGDIRGVLNGSGAMLVKNSNQAIITDLKSRSYRSPNNGTAVAINDQQMAMNSQRRIDSSSIPTQKRDSETNTDLSALQSSRNARQQQMNDTTDGAQQGDVHRGGGVINAGGQSNRSIGATNNSTGHHQAVFAGGPGGIIYTESQTSGQYSSSSLERQSHTAMLLARKKYAQQAQMANEYQSGSLGRRNSENQSKSRIDGSIYSSVLSRNKSCRNYGNIDDYTAADHGSPGRPLSETITNANGTPSHFYLKSGRSPRGVLSETDSVEDLSYSPYNLRNIPSSPKLLNSRSLQQHNEEMQATGYSQMDNYYATRSDHQLSMSPGSTLHRAESLHMASAKGARGSSLSLMSNSSSVYSTAEEKQSQEIRKLRRELEAAQEKVNTLTTQLSTNAHVVAAFEQSLANMTQRLQHLTNTSQQKDSELNEMRSMIDALKQQNFGHPVRSGTLPRVSVSSNSSATQSIKEPMAPADFDISSSDGCHEAPTDRSLSTTKSVSSLNSLSSACSGLSQQSAATEADRKKKKKSWLKSSFSRAFSRKKSKLGSATDVEGDTSSLRSETSLVSAQETSHTMSTPTTPTKETHLSAVMTKSDCSTEAVFQLKQQLHEKDLKLTDIQLEALSSAHQLEQLYDIMNRMKSEMTSLKVDNERLQRAILQKGIDPLMVLSQGEDSSSMSPDDLRTSLSEPQGGEVVHEIGRSEGKRVKLIVCFRSCTDSTTVNESKPMEVVIGALNINSSTQWELLDGTVRKAFKEYLIRVEPGNSLGLTFDSILYYQVGDVIRTKSANPPKLLPINCLIGESSCVSIVLKGSKENSIDCLAFEMLVPKSIVHRYVSLLVEHRRIILCGPSGTGKTYLAQKLADHVVSMEGKDVSTGLTATFNVDHKSGKELRQYLANIADQCEHSASELPSVIILDNLHHVGSLSEVFTGFLSVKHQQCPYIIGTMNQTTCSTNNLQLHHNFRWVLCANHMEPVKGFLGRYLRHRLVEEEVRTGLRNVQLDRIVDWLPFVWQHVNKFLESRGSSDVTIGPRLFLSCPVDESAAQVWFTDLWNHSVVPYLLEAVREGFQNYGNRGTWEDPSDWVNETYPWEKMEKHSLLRLRPEDVGRDNVVQGVTSVSMTSSFGKGNVAANPDMSPRQATTRSTGTNSETGANVTGYDMASTSTSLTPATYSPPPTTTRVSSLATTSSVATK